ncbi:MAG: fibro-slime domain-containing protein [Pseudomonadota bacterium]
MRTLLAAGHLPLLAAPMAATLVATLGATVGVGAAAAAVALPATIRDFTAVHPDFAPTRPFEGFGLTPGAVEARLDSDRKPAAAFDAGSAPRSFSTPGNLAQWYRDVPGVNLSDTIALLLQEGGGVTSFADDTFFPINGRLQADDQEFLGVSSNFYFTVEVEGFITIDEGDTFTASSDDDLWLFVDNQLVLDLGGAHGEVDGTVTFSAGLLAALGLMSGETTRFKLFYAERNVAQAVLAFETTADIARIPVPPALLLLASAVLALGAAARQRV